MTALRKFDVIDNVRPEPPYPAELRAKGFTFSIDWERVTQSATWIKCPPDMRPWLLMLWTVSWTNAPAGTYDADDELIAAQIGMEPRVFAANRDHLMRGWRLHADGKLYHDFITTLVLEMAGKREKDRARVAEWRQRQQEKLDKAESVTRNKRGRSREYDTGTGTGTGAGTGTGEQQPTVVVGNGTAYRCPPTPTADVVSLYHKHLPTLPRIDILSDDRKRVIRARWKAVCTDAKLDKQGGLEWFAWFFHRVTESPWLMGRIKGKSGDHFTCTLDFLMTPSKFVRVVEGFYHRGQS